MMRHDPRGLAPSFGRQVGWTAALLAAAVCLAPAGEPARTGASGDSHGDPLPAGALARLGTTRLRHGSDLNFVGFGPSGKTLLTAGQDQTIRLWDLADGKEIRRFPRPKQPVPKAPPRGKPAAGEKVEVEAAIQLMMGGGRDDGARFRVALTPDGKTLAVGEGSVVELWEVETGKQTRRIEEVPGGFAGLVLSPDGKTLAARTDNGTLVLWATETGKEVRQIKPAPRPRQDGFVIVLGGDDTPPPGIGFSPDGKTLAAAATDYKKDHAVHSVKLWDVASGKENLRIPAPDGINVSSVAVAPGGKLLAYGGGDVIHLCETDTGKEVRRLKAPGGVFALVFSPDGKTMAARGRNQVVRLWETETGKEVRQLAEPQAPQQGGGLFLGAVSRPEARALAISPDSKHLAAGSGSSFRVWETATGKELPLLDGHRRAPSAIALTPDGTSAFSWADRVVRRWDTATGKFQGAFTAPAGTRLAAFSPDGRSVAFANADNTIRVHEVATGKETHKIQGPQGGTSALAYSPDGRVLAARGSADNVIRLYDAAKGAEVRQMAQRPANNPAPGGAVLILGGPRRAPRGTAPGLAFSPDGKLIVMAGPGQGALSSTLVFFDVATGKELRKIESSRPIAGYAFSPDGRSLATENADRTISLWEVASAREQAHLGQPAEPQDGNAGMGGFRVVIDGIEGGSFTDPAGPLGLAFAPDGRSLAVRGRDRAVHVWDLAAGKEIGKLEGHGGRVETVAFAADGKRLASGATDTTILLWETSDPLKNLSKPETAELTAAEVESLWKELASEDAGKALRSVRKLAGAPRQALPLLGEQLRPAACVDPRKVNGWIADLESEKFAVRQEAVANLLKVGDQAVPALRKALAGTPPLETRKRVEDLLDRLTGGTLTSEQLRVVRAVEVLERMGSPEARRLLTTLAGGAPGTLPTREAEAALARGQKSEVRGQ